MFDLNMITDAMTQYVTSTPEEVTSSRVENAMYQMATQATALLSSVNNLVENLDEADEDDINKLNDLLEEYLYDIGPDGEKTPKICIIMPEGDMIYKEDLLDALKININPQFTFPGNMCTPDQILMWYKPTNSSAKRWVKTSPTYLDTIRSEWCNLTSWPQVALYPMALYDATTGEFVETSNWMNVLNQRGYHIGQSALSVLGMTLCWFFGAVGPFDEVPSENSINKDVASVLYRCVSLSPWIFDGEMPAEWSVGAAFGKYSYTLSEAMSEIQNMLTSVIDESQAITALNSTMGNIDKTLVAIKTYIQDETSPVVEALRTTQMLPSDAPWMVKMSTFLSSLHGAQPKEDSDGSPDFTLFSPGDVAYNPFAAWWANGGAKDTLTAFGTVAWGAATTIVTTISAPVGAIMAAASQAVTKIINFVGQATDVFGDALKYNSMVGLPILPIATPQLVNEQPFTTETTCLGNQFLGLLQASGTTSFLCRPWVLPCMADRHHASENLRHSTHTPIGHAFAAMNLRPSNDKDTSWSVGLSTSSCGDEVVSYFLGHNFVLIQAIQQGFLPKGQLDNPDSAAIASVTWTTGTQVPWQHDIYLYADRYKTTVNGEVIYYHLFRVSSETAQPNAGIIDAPIKELFAKGFEAALQAQPPFGDMLSIHPQIDDYDYDTFTAIKSKLVKAFPDLYNIVFSQSRWTPVTYSDVAKVMNVVVIGLASAVVAGIGLIGKSVYKKAMVRKARVAQADVNNAQLAFNQAVAAGADKKTIGKLSAKLTKQQKKSSRLSKWLSASTATEEKNQGSGEQQSQTDLTNLFLDSYKKITGVAWVYDE